MRRAIIILIIIIFMSKGAAASNWTVSYSQEVFEDNNYFSILNIAKKNYLPVIDDFTSSGWMIVDDERRIILENGNYLIGYIQEIDGWLKATSDTVAFIVETETGRQSNQQSYQVELDAWYQQLEGILLGAEVFPRANCPVSLQINGKLLSGQELTQQHYKGTITREGEHFYFSGFKDGIASNLNQAVTLQDIEFTSWGYSIGYKLNWELDQGWILEASGENIYSQIKWNNVYTLVMAYEDYSYTDDQVSVGKGYYGYQDYETSLAPEYNLALINQRVTLGLFYRYSLYPYIDYQLLTSPVELTMGLYREFFSVAVKYKGLKAALRSKNLDLSVSSGLWGTVGVEFSF